VTGLEWNSSNDRHWAELLAEVPLFSKVGKRKLRKVAQEAQFAEYAPGESVVLTGAPADSFFVILSGKANVVGRPGARTLETCDYFGELALLGDGKRSATVVAASDLHVMRVPRPTFERLLSEAGVAQELTSELGARLRRAEKVSS
jgi:CRP-like cAMP-binding protein